jgi:hypothetical protein
MYCESILLRVHHVAAHAATFEMLAIEELKLNLALFPSLDCVQL